MYTLQSPSSNTHQNMSNFYHCRTPSHSRLVPNSPIMQNRPPSQKKLSITCTLKNPIEKEGLRKRSGQVSEMKGKFASMQSSYIRQALKQTKEGCQDVDGQMKQYLKIVELKLEALRSNYAVSLSEMSTKMEELQTKLASNQRELRRKNGQIEQLEILCRSQQNKLALLCHPQHLQVKIDDLNVQLRIMGQHCEQMQQEQFQKYDRLATKTIAYFGNKLANLREQSSDFVRSGLIALQEAELRLTQLQLQREKGCSQGTRGSMQSVGESILNLTQSQQPDQGVSFWDDCFFHPPSDNYQLITEMAKRRGEPLRCWIDQFNYLRYCDSSSYVYNRKGDRVKLTSQEVGSLLELNLLAL